jgi:hypothetical protein
MPSGSLFGGWRCDSVWRHRQDKFMTEAGALVGAAVGAAAATLIGQAPTQGQCLYCDANGRQITAPC